MLDRISQIIQSFQLLPHPEGGYYRETYRSPGTIRSDCLDKHYPANRNLSTCIYYLLLSDSFSAFHRIMQDEIWHFYDGSPIDFHQINRDGRYSKIAIGRNFSTGQVPQYVIPGGSWFAAEIADRESYALVGCTVAPGFDFADFELGKRDQLLHAFPQQASLIKRLTRE